MADDDQDYSESAAQGDPKFWQERSQPSKQSGRGKSATQRAAKGLQQASKKLMERSTAEAAARTGQRGPQGTERQVEPLNLQSLRKGGSVRRGQVVRLHRGEKVRGRRKSRMRTGRT